MDKRDLQHTGSRITRDIFDMLDKQDEYNDKNKGGLVEYHTPLRKNYVNKKVIKTGVRGAMKFPSITFNTMRGSAQGIREAVRESRREAKDEVAFSHLPIDVQRKLNRECADAKKHLDNVIEKYHNDGYANSQEMNTAFDRAGERLDEAYIARNAAIRNIRSANPYLKKIASVEYKEMVKMAYEDIAGDFSKEAGLYGRNMLGRKLKDVTKNADAPSFGTKTPMLSPVSNTLRNTRNAAGVINKYNQRITQTNKKVDDGINRLNDIIAGLNEELKKL